MLDFFRRQWFLTTLALLIVSGMTLGVTGHGPQAMLWARFVQPEITTGCVLFLMAFSLDSAKLHAAIRAPGPVVLAFLMNYGVIPALAWGLMPLQRSADFRFGLMIAASVPCTVAAASVMTRKSKGNDAVSLLATLSTNLVCFLLTPLWLQLTTATRVELDTRKLMLDLLVVVLTPTLAGQLLRQPAAIKEFASRHKTPIGVAAQILIELLVFTAALRAGMALANIEGSESSDGSGQSQPITGSSILLVWLSCVALHLGSLWGGWFVSRRLGIDRANSSAVAFAGSQKTLPIGLYISTNPATFGGAYPFAMFPMLLYHTSQLFLDTAIAAWFARSAEGPVPPASGEGNSVTPN